MNNVKFKLFEYRAICHIMCILWIALIVFMLIVYPCVFFGDWTNNRLEQWHQQGMYLDSNDIQAWQNWMDSRPKSVEDFAIIYLFVLLGGALLSCIPYYVAAYFLQEFSNCLIVLSEKPSLMDKSAALCVLSVAGNYPTWLKNIETRNKVRWITDEAKYKVSRTIYSILRSLTQGVEKNSYNMGNGGCDTNTQTSLGYYGTREAVRQQIEQQRKEIAEKQEKEALQRQQKKESEERQRIIKELERLNNKG